MARKDVAFKKRGWSQDGRVAFCDVRKGPPLQLARLASLISTVRVGQLDAKRFDLAEQSAGMPLGTYAQERQSRDEHLTRLGRRDRNQAAGNWQRGKSHETFGETCQILDLKGR